MSAPLQRRLLLCGSAAWAAGLALSPASARATPQDMDAAILRFTGGAPLREGRVRLEVAPLVDNGNTVPVAVSVQSPMSAQDHVSQIALFNERNPYPDVARFTLGPRAGRARVATRIRLATTQNLVAIARMSDGSFWQQRMEVVVVLAACIE